LLPGIIILKIAGEPKKEVDLNYMIDLRHKGIEKLRLTPRQINNGERERHGASNLPCCHRTNGMIWVCAGKHWSMWAAAGSSFATTRSRRATAGP